MTQRPFFLITNDDGIHAPGIKHLWEAVVDWADVAIVAPHAEKSGCGLSITWTKPLQVRQVPWDMGTSAWSINGTPADCIKMAMSVLLEKPPHLILSGVNRGSNAGRTVLYSGTVGGVIEGTLRNIPGIAFSYSDFDIPPLNVIRPYINAVVKRFLEHPLPYGTFLNVTFPCNCHEGIKGLRFAKQGKGYWIEEPDRRIHPQGIPYYWLGGKWCSFEEEAESEVTLLEQGFATVAPIHIAKLTDEALYEQHKDHLFDLQEPDSVIR